MIKGLHLPTACKGGGVNLLRVYVSKGLGFCALGFLAPGFFRGLAGVWGFGLRCSPIRVLGFWV